MRKRSSVHGLGELNLDVSHIALGILIDFAARGTGQRGRLIRREKYLPLGAKLRFVQLNRIRTVLARDERHDPIIQLGRSG